MCSGVPPQADQVSAVKFARADSPAAENLLARRSLEAKEEHPKP
jgi:hypothetical protein